MAKHLRYARCPFFYLVFIVSTLFSNSKSLQSIVFYLLCINLITKRRNLANRYRHEFTTGNIGESRLGHCVHPGRDMYQIILIIENGGNVTPTRCCARRQRTVLAAKNTMNYNALRAAYNNIFTIPFLATKGVALMGVWLHRNLLTNVVAFPARVNSPSYVDDDDDDRISLP